MEFRNLILSRIAEDDMARLIPSMREVLLGREQLLHDAGEVVPYIYFPSTAVASVVRVMKDGGSVETTTVGFENAPGVLEALTRLPATNRVSTQVPGSAIRIASPALRDAALASPALMNLLLTFTQASIAQLELSVACNALHEVPSRLARWILMTQDRFNNHLVPLTQDFLAVMLGVQRSTVSTAASILKKRGLIHYTRGNIGIVDREGLVAVACECYAASRDIIDQVAP